jgi:hypothetical protein
MRQRVDIWRIELPNRRPCCVSAPIAAGQNNPAKGSEMTAVTVLANIQPGTYIDPDSEKSISISVSDRYSMITINKQCWYFIRETGAFDGTSTTLVDQGPILASDSTRPDTTTALTDHPVLPQGEWVGNLAPDRGGSK